MLKVRYFLPGNLLNAEPGFTWMHLRENRMHKKVSRPRIAWWKTVNPTLAAGRNLSLVLLMQEANLALREAGKEEACQVYGVCNWVTAWKQPWWHTLVAIPWLWRYECLYRLCHQVIRCDVTGLLCLQKAEEQQAFLCPQQQVTPWARYTAVQNSDLTFRSSPNVASVLWALCHVCSGMQAGLPLAFGNRAHGRAYIWGWAPTLCLWNLCTCNCTCNCTFKS